MSARDWDAAVQARNQSVTRKQLLE